MFVLNISDTQKQIRLNKYAVKASNTLHTPNDILAIYILSVPKKVPLRNLREGWVIISKPVFELRTITYIHEIPKKHLALKASFFFF